MLSDHNRDLREKAVKLILNCRHIENSLNLEFPNEPRKFKIPKVNFESSTYYNLIDLDQITITEPPLTSSLTDMELKLAIERPLIFPPYPCHSQHVERWVKEVTEASIKRYDHQGRHRLILNRAISREYLPHFNVKKDYVIFNEKIPKILKFFFSESTQQYSSFFITYSSIP